MPVLDVGTAGNPFALAAAAAAFLTKKRGWRIGIGVTALACGMMTIVLGVGSYFYWMVVVNEAVVSADPERQSLLREAGHMEAMNNVWMGLCGSALPILLGGFAVARGVFGEPDDAR